MTRLDGLARRELIVLTGKGGVGKSTLAAALGCLIAEHGRRVLLLEIDPRESLYQLLGVDPSDGSYREIRPGLLLQTLRPRDVLGQVVREHLWVEFVIRRVLASPVYHHFTEAAPGLKELAVLGHAFRLVRQLAGEDAPSVDLVILDAPATGHGLSLLAAPRLVSDVIQDGPFRRMSGELADFLADPRSTGIVVATLAEEMPVQEAIELLDAMDDRLSRTPELMIVNGLYPDRAGHVAVDRVVDDLWKKRRGINDRELARLAQRWDGPRVDLPLLPHDRGPGLVDALLDLLRAALKERAA